MNRALAVAFIRLGCAVAVLSGLIGAVIVAEEFLPFAIAFSLFLVGHMALLFAVDVAKIAGASPSPGGLRRALVAFASLPQIAKAEILSDFFTKAFLRYCEIFVTC